MRTEEDKAKVELEIFHEFVTKRNLPFDLQTARKLDPNKKEPDILCKHEHDGYIAFELVEICDPKLAQVKSQANKEDVGGVEFFWTSDPSGLILSKKLNKNYHVGYPVELLCYTAGRVVTSDDVIIPTILPLLDSKRGAFRRVWLLGTEGAWLVWEIDNEQGDR
jgi:hypothetical protein